MFHLQTTSFEDHEPTIKDMMVLLLSIDSTLDGIFHLMHGRGCGSGPFDDEDGPIPSMFTAVAFLDHEERIERLEALLKKD